MGRLFQIVASFLLLGVFHFANGSSFWQDAELPAFRSATQGDTWVNTVSGRYLIADVNDIRRLLLNQDEADIEIPLPNGELAIYHLSFSSVAASELHSRFPDIRTFRGIDVDNSVNKGRFSISPTGFRAMFNHNGKTIFIDPYYRDGDDYHVSYYTDDARRLSPRPAESVIYTDLLNAVDLAAARKNIAAKGSSDSNMRTYRLAIAATGEYTQALGGSVNDAMNGIMDAVNRLNQVYERDLGIHLELVANNQNLVFTDPDTDPFPDNIDINSSQLVFDNVALLGPNNYDVGHVFTTGNSGIAKLGSVCSDGNKAGAFSGSDSPTNDRFWIDLVAHELGHQFGANHSFNGTDGSCGVDPNRNEETAYEPGSGSTVMAYAGICGSQNLQNSSDAYFHAGSIAEITQFITDPSTGGRCAQVSAQVNNVPDVDAGADFVIPAVTPFILSGSATDLDNDTLTYTWEQFDTGSESSGPSSMVDNGNRPIFRSFSPASNASNPGQAIRSLPLFASVLTSSTILGEAYPTTDRNLNFRLTARDGNGATAFDDVVVSVTRDAGPFLVTEPELGESWSPGAQTVLWDVANTDQPPVNCPNVRILLSTDNGLSFPVTLAASTPNDGRHIATVPSGVSGEVRVYIGCLGAVSDRFYAVSGSRPDVEIGEGSSFAGSSGGGGGGGSLHWLQCVMLLCLLLMRKYRLC